MIVDDHHANLTLSGHDIGLAKTPAKGEGEVYYVLGELTDEVGMLSATGTSMAT
jgi:hypothetical protein